MHHALDELLGALSVDGFVVLAVVVKVLLLVVGLANSALLLDEVHDVHLVQVLAHSR